MTHVKTKLLLFTIFFSLLSRIVLLGGQGAETATLYRDEFGIPHV